MNNNYSSTLKVFEFLITTLVSVAPPILNISDIQINDILLLKYSGDLERDDIGG